MFNFHSLVHLSLLADKEGTQSNNHYTGMPHSSGVKDLMILVKRNVCDLFVGFGNEKFK